MKQLTELEEWQQAASVEAGLRREFYDRAVKAEAEIEQLKDKYSCEQIRHQQNIERLEWLGTAKDNANLAYADRNADLAKEIERLTKERDFAMAAHDGQVQDKVIISKELASARAEIERLNRIINCELGSD